MKRTLLSTMLLGALALAVVVAPIAVKLADDPESALPDVSIEMNEAEAAAGTGTLTIGDLTIDYYTTGETEWTMKKGNQVLVYFVLTSAETTNMRKIFTTIPQAAAGGQTKGTYDAIDGTVTLPMDPIYGDLTD